MTAKLEGFLGRKTDGELGTITLWRGLIRLEAMVLGYRAGLQAAQRLPSLRDGPYPPVLRVGKWQPPGDFFDTFLPSQKALLKFLFPSILVHYFYTNSMARKILRR